MRKLMTLPKLILLAVLTGGGLLHAAEPVAVPSDLSLTMSCRQALSVDPETNGLNLLISVKDRVAVVGGPITDLTLVPKVESALKKVPGISDVKVTCWQAGATEDPLLAKVGERLKETASAPPIAIGPKPVYQPTPPSLTVIPRPVPETKPAEPLVTVKRMTAGTPPESYLLDPVTPGGTSLTPLPMPTPAYAPIPSPSVPVLPVSQNGTATPEGALNAIRKLDARYAGLTLDLKSGTVIIQGKAASNAAVWDLAQAVRKSPGVDRVIVGRVDIR